MIRNRAPAAAAPSSERDAGAVGVRGVGRDGGATPPHRIGRMVWGPAKGAEGGRTRLHPVRSTERLSLAARRAPLLLCSHLAAARAARRGAREASGGTGADALLRVRNERACSIRTKCNLPGHRPSHLGPLGPPRPDPDADSLMQRSRPPRRGGREGGLSASRGFQASDEASRFASSHLRSRHSSAALARSFRGDGPERPPLFRARISRGLAGWLVLRTYVHVYLCASE